MEVAGRSKVTDSNRKSIKHGVICSLEFKLDELRKKLASDDGGIFPHSILSAQQMSSISTHKPHSIEELQKIIGKLKTEKYGNRILEEVEKYGIRKDDVSSEEDKTEIRPKKKLKTEKEIVHVESSDDES